MKGDAGMELPFAEEINYWKSSTTHADTWIAKARDEIERAGGEVLGWAFGAETSTGRGAYMIEFVFGAERFRAAWPVLPSRGGAESAARIQAATLLYHDVKARAVRIKVFGPRVAFFDWLLLPDGRTTAAVADEDLLQHLPALLRARAAPLLLEGELVDERGRR